MADPTCTTCGPEGEPHTHVSQLLAGRIRGMLAPGGLVAGAPTEASTRDLIPDVNSRDDFTADYLIRYHAVRAASHHTATHASAAAMVGVPVGGARFRAAAQQMARNAEAGAAHLNAATLLHLIATKAPELVDVAVQSIWDVTQECGALNGEWEDAVQLLLGYHGIVTGDAIIAANTIDLTATTKETP